MIELKNVQCRVQGKLLLDIENLHIKAGEKVAIMGHNGAGKSTLLKMLTGFMPVTRGTLVINGHAMQATPSPRQLRQLRAEVGQVFQGLHLVGRLSVLENVLIGMLAQTPLWRSCTRLFSSTDRKRALQALEIAGIAHLADTRADRLSGGERQKVAIARMLMQNPKLILADEPTAALDPNAAKETCELLKNVSQHVTLVSVIHSESLLPMLADRIIGLKQGKIILDCAVSDYEADQSLKLYD